MLRSAGQDIQKTLRVEIRCSICKSCFINLTLFFRTRRTRFSFIASSPGRHLPSLMWNISQNGAGTIHIWCSTLSLTTTFSCSPFAHFWPFPFLPPSSVFHSSIYYAADGSGVHTQEICSNCKHKYLPQMVLQKEHRFCHIFVVLKIINSLSMFSAVHRQQRLHIHRMEPSTTVLLPVQHWKPFYNHIRGWFLSPVWHEVSIVCQSMGARLASNSILLLWLFDPIQSRKRHLSWFLQRFLTFHVQFFA